MLGREDDRLPLGLQGGKGTQERGEPARIAPFARE